METQLPSVTAIHLPAANAASATQPQTYGMLAVLSSYTEVLLPGRISTSRIIL